MTSKLEPWEEHPDVWSTKAKFFSWLRGEILVECSAAKTTKNVQVDYLPPCEDWGDITLFASASIKVTQQLRDVTKQSNQFAEVYWIHTPEQVNPFTDGYIGVSTNTEERYKKHLRDANVKQSFVNKKRQFTEALKTGRTQLDVLFSGTMSECYLKEQAYRPNTNIGWNIAIGGNGGVPKHGLTEKLTTKTFYNTRRRALKEGKEFEWMGDLVGFTEFYNKNRPEDGGLKMTLKDLSGGYTADNIVWKSTKEMLRPYLKNRKTIAGDNAPLCALCEKYNIPQNRVASRLRDGWTLDEALELVSR